MEKKSTQGLDRMTALFDAGTFVEIGSFVRRSGKPEEFEGVICGYGAIDGKLVFAYAQDGDRMKGAFDEVQARKIENLYKMAIENGAPVIAMLDSAGALVYEGSAVLSGYGRMMKCVSKASGVIPQIAVISGICSGMLATIASMYDFVITVKGESKLYVNPPFATGEALDADASAALVAENADDAVVKAKALMALLPANNADGTVLEVNEDDMNRQVSVKGLEADALVAAIADCGKFLELYAAYDKAMKVGFASFGGITAGVVFASGAITAKGAKKAAKFVSLCDSFGIPTVTLVDSEGVAEEKGTDSATFAADLAKLAFAYTSAKNAKVTVTLGKAYGAAYTLMGSKSVGADVAFALEKAEISVLSPKASVAFAWNDKITAEKTREDLENEWKEKCASPVFAAEMGEIDDVIEEAELRQRICAALGMLFSKAQACPTRKHVNMPL